MDAWRDVLKVGLAILILAAIAAILGNCARPVIPTPPPAKPVPRCSAPLLDMPAEYCQTDHQLRDSSGYDCAFCSGQRACLSAETFTYCTDDRGCGDVRCF